MTDDNIDMSPIEGDVVQPSMNIVDRELDLLILQMGSFLSILHNKKINHAKMLIFLLKNEKYRSCFLRICEIDNLQALIQALVIRYPSLCRSKVVFGEINRINEHNKRRKKSL